ncbi:MAG: hypothetical protein M1816_005302 [Peltula sp. TS41687]|nr:MAG: hypothetical protein M1816_005302 [Peltula sp. TS41687]
MASTAAIPSLSQVRKSSLSGHDGRRRSLPAPSTKHRSRPSKTLIDSPDAASPEIISSLISSLSAISLPASRLFEEGIPPTDLTRSTPTSPNAVRTTFGGSHPYRHHRAPPSPRVSKSHRVGSDAGIYHDSVEFLHPDVAATPPVIPTSRRTSTQAPADGVQWNGGDSTNFWRKYLSGGGDSIIKGHEDDQIDPLDSSRSPIKLSTSVAESNRAARPQKGLTDLSANERLKQEENRHLGGKTNARRDDITFIPARDSSVGKASTTKASKPDSHSKLRYPVRTDDDVTEQGGPRTSGADTLLVSRDVTRKSKTSKTPSPILLMSEPADKLRTPVRSPAIIRSKSSPAKSGQPSNENQSPDANEESAPFPAIPLVKDHDASSNRTNSNGALKQFSTPPSTKTSADAHRAAASSGSPRRFNSRLKRRSQVSEPKSGHRHHRSFSNPLRRSSPTPPGPQVVPDDRVSKADSIEDAVDAYLCSPRLSQKIRHPETGRVISFSEVGDSEGFAVFCCVGMGLTRYITAFYDELALTLRLRLITPDRPGVGESDPYPDGAGTPLGWPDDVYAICQAMKITKFSILAHSAGAIYALATALRMPQHIRGRMHLLAPWIPPSQLSSIGNGGRGSKDDYPPAGSVPTSQRILRALPTPFLRVANSNFMSSTSSSLTSSLPKSPRRKRKTTRNASPSPNLKDGSPEPPRNSLMYPYPSEPTLLNSARQQSYDTRLAHSIWSLSTTNANPTIDLLVCLERRQPIGFRYADITRPPIVIHHGSRDTRVPLENVKWLSSTMKKCEVRVLEGEGHGLMASASVMGSVLVEISKEWEDWDRVVRSTAGGRGDWPFVVSFTTLEVSVLEVSVLEVSVLEVSVLEVSVLEVSVLEVFSTAVSKKTTVVASRKRRTDPEPTKNRFLRPKGRRPGPARENRADEGQKKGAHHQPTPHEAHERVRLWGQHGRRNVLEVSVLEVSVLEVSVLEVFVREDFGTAASKKATTTPMKMATTTPTKKAPTTPSKKATTAASKKTAVVGSHKRRADPEPVPTRKRQKTGAADEACATQQVLRAKTAPKKAIKKGPIINSPPQKRLNIFVFGGNTGGELSNTRSVLEVLSTAASKKSVAAASYKTAVVGSKKRSADPEPVPALKRQKTAGGDQASATQHTLRGKTAPRKARKKGAAVNNPSIRHMNVYVFGANTGGEIANTR